MKCNTFPTNEERKKEKNVNLFLNGEKKKGEN